MRKNNVTEMTIVEQIVAIRESVCTYSCKYKEEVNRKYRDPITQKVMVQQYCKECPLPKLHFECE